MAPGAALYYLFRGPEQARAFPAGFRMIAGDMTRRTPYNDIDPSFVPYVSYVCMDFDGVSQYITAFPNKTCPSGLRAQLNFPACWDGVNLDSPTHNTHVAYSTGDNFDQNACPSTHPVRLPEIFAEVSWQVADFPYTAGPWPFVWSFNDTTGYGYHGDFVNGWDVAAFQAALDQNCTSLDDCDAFHIRDSTEAATCTLQNLTANLPYVSERVLGTLPNLIIGTGSPVVAVNAYNAINSAAQNGHCSTFPQINYAGTPVLNTSTYHSSLPAGAIMLTTAATTPSCYESYEGWQSDAAYVSGGAFAGLATSTTVVQSPLGAVLTDDEVRQAVYTSNRWGLFSYNIPVAVAGQYNIRLVFAVRRAPSHAAAVVRPPCFVRPHCPHLHRLSPCIVRAVAAAAAMLRRAIGARLAAACSTSRHKAAPSSPTSTSVPSDPTPPSRPPSQHPTAAYSKSVHTCTRAV